MVDKPKILWIDDIYGKTRNGHNKDRATLCSRLGLKDITGDCLPQAEPELKTLSVIDDREATDAVPMDSDEDDEVVADVIFSQGQIEERDVVTNDLDGTLEMVRNGWEQPPRWSLLLLDMHFATGAIGEDGEPVGKDEDWDPASYFGLTVLDSLWRDSELRDIPVVITSAMARDVIERRFTTQGVWAFVDRKDLNRAKLKELLQDYGLLADDKIIGNSLPLLQCLREARRRARIPTENILILGESGTERKLLAEYIHQQSGREGDYVSFSPVLEDTLEDELSDDGTLFIDKFGDIIATVQPQFLQLLKDNWNLQVVMAIEREEILSEDNFRQALPDGAQIHNFIRIPTLSQRSEDIPLLVESFVEKYEKESNAEPRQVSGEALEALKAYPWPGNVRELESVIKHAVFTYNELRWLEVDHLDLLSHETHVPPIPSNQPNSLDLFNIIEKDDLWEQFREVIGEMATWLQKTAIWILTEKALRGAITTIMSDRFGTDWFRSVSRTDYNLKQIFNGCDKRREDYPKDYPGENNDLPDLINFTNPSDLFKIILHDNLWSHFREFFGRNDSDSDNDWTKYWQQREGFILYRVRHLMNHSNPDLIRSYDHDIFKGYCGEILEICQTIETGLSERGQQEELYDGIVRSIMPNGDIANVEIDEYLTLQSRQVVKVPKCDFKSDEAFNPNRKVKFKVEGTEQEPRVYDVVLAEPK